jgi:hypothetical protein
MNGSNAQQNPSLFERDTRNLVDKLEIKMDSEISKIERHLEVMSEQLYDKMEQQHNKNTTRFTHMENCIYSDLKDYSKKNEEYKNMTTASMNDLTEKFSQRLPLWTTFLISGLCGTLTVSIGALLALLSGLITLKWG